LLWTDYVNIVAFSSSTKVYGDALLYQAVDDKLKDMDSWLTTLFAGGATNYEMAFEDAFHALLNSPMTGRSSNCHKMILFMSDGEISEGAEGQELERKLTELNTADVGAIVLTYEFGDEMQSDLLQRIACQHKGITWSVPDGGDLAGTMGSYMKYFAAPSTVGRMKWQNYTFASDASVTGMSGCMPVYDLTLTPKELLGVTCADMSIFASVPDLETRPDWRIFEMKRVADSLECPHMDLNDNDLNAVRKYASGDGAICSVCQANSYCEDSQGVNSVGRTTPPRQVWVAPVLVFFSAVTVRV